MRTPSPPAIAPPSAPQADHQSSRDNMALYGVELTLAYSNFRPLPESHGLRISIQLQLDNRQSFLELSQTETIFDLPTSSFTQKSSIPYRFDGAQLIRFRALRVTDESERLFGVEGEVDVPLAALVCSPLQIPLSFPSGLVLNAQVRIPPTNSDYVRLQFVGEHLKSYNNYPLGAYFIVVIVSERRRLLLYKSEIIRSKDAKWAPFRVPMHPMESGGNLQVHVFNSNTNAQDSLIGYFVTTLSQLMRGTGSGNTYMLMDQSGARRSDKLLVELKSVERDSGPSFFDVVRSGCDLRPSIAIDFTASNGSPLNPASLHYIHPHEPGAYSRSLLHYLTPLSYHLRDQRMGALGFGAKVGPNLVMNNCFPLSAHGEQVSGVNGVLDAYRRASLALQPFGPTQYADVIYHTSQFAKASVTIHMNAFFLQFIFTDGCSKMDARTVDALVDASFTPMAVIFVLVGTKIENPQRTKELDNVRAVQGHPLKHSDGRVAGRQVVIVLSEDDAEDGFGLVPLLIAQWKNLTEASA